MAQPRDGRIESVLSELREQARTSDTPIASKSLINGQALSGTAPDLVILRQYNILDAPFKSHRRLLGRLIISVKNLVKESLIQVLGRQVAYNEANTHVASALLRTTERLERGYSELSEALKTQRLDLAIGAKSLSELESRIDAQAKSIDELKTFAVRVEAQQPAPFEHVQELKRLVLDQQRRLAIVLEEVRRRGVDDESLPRVAEQRDHLLDTLYLMLEDQSRGTRADIKRGLEVYLPYISRADSRSVKVVDIGCGRGEFLELLREHGVDAEGVDRNHALTEQCLEQGLQVTEADAISFLRGKPDNSYAAASAIQFAEHLPFRSLVALIDEILRVLKPGGLMILETPNPENLLVGSSQFYLDPTHRRPLPINLLRALVEMRGFCRVEVLKLHPFEQVTRLHGSEMAERLNELLYGPQDYAVLATKM